MMNKCIECGGLADGTTGDDPICFACYSQEDTMIKVGDVVTRMLAGTIPMDLKVTEVTDNMITCGCWYFDRATGAEIDDDLNWGPPPKATGSFIKVEK